jgi:hypothetical protein
VTGEAELAHPSVGGARIQILAALV